jgi:hypothetical protein
MKDEGGRMKLLLIHPSSFLLHPSQSGAGDEIRTRDPQLGRLMLYQLSYTRSRNDEVGTMNDELLFRVHRSEFIVSSGAGGRIRTCVRR